MKSILLNTILLLISLFINVACCTKMDCRGVEGIYKIELSKFSAEDADSVLVVSYNKRYRQVNLPTDSVMMKVTHHITSPPFIYFPSKFDYQLDYKLQVFPNTETFTISDFVIKKAVCNKCFLGNDYYSYVQDYFVNGKPHQEGGIRISN